MIDEPGGVDDEYTDPWERFLDALAIETKPLSDYEVSSVKKALEFLLASSNPLVTAEFRKRAEVLDYSNAYEVREMHAELVAIAEATQQIGEANRRAYYQSQADAATHATKVQEVKAKKLVDKQAEQEAAREIAAQNYKGTREVGVEDLFKKVEWLVEDLIPRRGTSFLVARPNLGKTFTAEDMIGHGAFGAEWLGKATVPFRTMWVAGEGLAGLGARLEAWCSHNGVELAALLARVKIVDGACLTSDSSLEKLSEIANRHEADLIVFDTYAATSGVISEDDAAMNQAVVNAAREIRPESAVLFLHHPTKATEASDCPVMRGSGALSGTVDSVMTLWRDPDFSKDPLRQGWFALSTENSHGGKCRDARTQTIRGLRIIPVDDSAVMVHNPDSADAPEPSKAEQRVIKHLIGCMTVAEYQEAAGISHGTATNDLKKYGQRVSNAQPEQWTKKGA